MYIIRSNTILTNLSIYQQQSRCLMSSPNTQCTAVYPTLSIIIVCNNYILSISLYQLLSSFVIIVFTLD